MQFGSVLGINLTGLLLGPAGMSWRWVCVLYAWPGLVWSVWFFNGFRERPELHPGVGEAERRLIEARSPADTAVAGTDPPETTPWLTMLTSFALWCICGQQFCRAAAAAFFQSLVPHVSAGNAGRQHRRVGPSQQLAPLGDRLGQRSGRLCLRWPAPAHRAPAVGASVVGGRLHSGVRRVRLSGYFHSERTCRRVADHGRIVSGGDRRTMRVFHHDRHGRTPRGFGIQRHEHVGKHRHHGFSVGRPVAALVDGRLEPGLVLVRRRCMWSRRCAGCLSARTARSSLPVGADRPASSRQHSVSWRASAREPSRRLTLPEKIMTIAETDRAEPVTTNASHNIQTTHR